MTQNKLFIISAPSGAGKTTLCARLLKDFPEIKLSISYTTRPPRGTEKHGVEYFFVTKDEFKKMISENAFAEYAEVHGNFYGTSKSFVSETLKTNSILFDIDVQGAESLRRSYGEQALSIFIAPPSLEILENRLRGRKTDTEEVIQKRMKIAAKEIAESPKFSVTIVNDDLERSYNELKTWTQNKING